MRYVFCLLLAAFLVGCNQDRRTSQGGAEQEQPDAASPSEPDTTSIHTDTTTSGGTNRQNQYDTLK